MIVQLSGDVAEKLIDQIVLDVSGVGYGIYVSSEDYGHLSQGKHTKVYIYEHIREAAYDLFGFIQIDTKRLFEQLLAVNGVGPKMALNILSIGNTDHVRSAIAGGDVKFIQRASGVGKRVAERVVVDLKDKVGLEGVELGSSGLLSSESVLMKDEAVEALVSLGFSPADASKALQQIDRELPTAERIRLALKQR